MQFGFEKGGGCERSISTVVNVVNYFLKRQSVYIVTLEATATFDRVNIYGLLSKLIDRGVAFDIIRVLHNWYCSNQACVRMMGYCMQYIDI